MKIPQKVEAARAEVGAATRHSLSVVVYRDGEPSYLWTSGKYNPN